MRVAVFGGSFDPVHLGHKRLAEFMLQRANLDKIIIMPAALSPFKTKYVSNDIDRLMMCRAEFSSPVYEVSDLEIRRGGKSYTVDTLSYLKKKYKNDSMFLILGSDQLLMFDKWYKCNEILTLASLIAVSRKADDNVSALEEYADKYIKPFGNCSIYQFKPLDISSSELRNMLSEGKDTSEYISSEVLSVIKSRGLYNGN